MLETATLDEAERSASCRREGFAPPGAQQAAIATLREHFDVTLDAMHDPRGSSPVSKPFRSSNITCHPFHLPEASQLV